MEPWFNSLIVALISGLVLAIFKVKLEQAVESAKEYIAIQFKNLTERADKAEAKMDELSREIHSVHLKVAVIASEQEHIKERLEIEANHARINS